VATAILQNWESDFTQKSSSFDDLSAFLPSPLWSHWPNCQQLMVLLKNTCNINGQKIQFLPDDEKLPAADLYYEERIGRTGIVCTRENNWHDFFNAMMWVMFPKIKQTISARHLHEISLQNSTKRTSVRDSLTHFDESGVIVAYSNADLMQQIVDHQWKQCFFESKNCWFQSIQPFILGHALYEKFLNPYIGLTGKALFVEVEQDFFGCSKEEQIQQLDLAVFKILSETDILIKPKNFKPLPLLGVPGWYEENKQVEFYDNNKYFREKSFQ
jgi:hypothetical protein